MRNTELSEQCLARHKHSISCWHFSPGSVLTGRAQTYGECAYVTEGPNSAWPLAKVQSSLPGPSLGSAQGLCDF